MWMYSLSVSHIVLFERKGCYTTTVYLKTEMVTK
jgi:hypothetical protein